MYCGTVSSLVVRASDFRPEDLGSMADATKYPPSTQRNTCSLNQWIRKSCGLNHECRGLENISLPFSSMPKLWRWRHLRGISLSKFVLPPVWGSRLTTGLLLVACNEEFRRFRSDCVR
ncbi:hypothetical protein TNCV_2857931 [Trichonephila clavipes]|nr:hypothetical protein TNCV_2857931 [Trichonephila clavipes]